MFCRLFNVKASLFVFVIAAFAMAAIACSSQPAAAPAPAPAPAQPAIDPAELSKLVQDAVKQSVPEQSAAPAPVSAQEIQSMVEAAVSAGAPEGASAEEISAMVQQAVAAAAQPAAQPGASKADIEDIVAKAVADAATSGASTLSADEVQMIVSDAIKSIPTAAPLVEKIEVVATPKAQGFLTRAPEPFPQRGGTMRTAFGVTMQHFDAHQGAGTHVLGHLYDGLFMKTIPDGLRTVTPLLATDWDISGDGLTYTFTIREGVQFHDGTPLTVDDVVVSFRRMAMPPEGVVSTLRDFYNVVDTIDAVDDNTVQFTLSEPRTWLLEVMTNTNHIVYSTKTLEENDNDLRQVEVAPGTGPFMFVSHTPAEKWVFEANPNYWNPEVPYLDRLEMLHVPAWTDRGTAVLTHQADFSWNVSMETHQEGLRRSDIVQTRRIPGFGAYNVNFNNQRKPLDDPRVRKAIRLGVSKQALIAAFGTQEPMTLTGWMSYASEGATSPEDLATMPGYREDKTDDIATAKQLLADAGYPNAEGIPDLDIVVASVAPHSEILAPAFQDQLLQSLGIEGKIRVTERALLGQNALAGEYDIQVTTAFGSPTQDPTPMWMQRLTCDGSQNQVHYCNPEFDMMVEALNKAQDPIERAQLFEQAKTFLDEENPLFVIGFTSHLPMWRNNVKGMSMEQRTHTCWCRLDSVWLDQEE
jgi:peptide/nickel transport system substrate-binding protein